MRPILLLTFVLLATFSNCQNETLSILFEKNSSEISANYAEQLSALHKRLKDKEIVVTAINSYCDTIGTLDYNAKLAERRLSSVLKKLQLSPKNNFIAFGEDFTFEAHRYKAEDHRRVDIIYNELSIDAFGNGESNTKKEEPKGKKEELASILTTTETELTVDFNFEFISGTAILLNPNDPELNDLVNFLKANLGIKAHIRGHVCCSDNQLISEQRAEAIYVYLTYSGVPKNQLSFKGYSNTLPIVDPEITEEDKQKNRRVDVVLSK